MFPIKDHAPSGKFPWVNGGLIIITLYIFFQELLVPDPKLFLTQWALIPAQVNFSQFSGLIQFLTSIFLHVGWVHIISNMWFLWIFGDNVEARLGHLTYLAFYLLSGVIAGLAQYLVASSSTLPILGASGAVAGVLGAYLVFFPKHKVETLVPVFGWFTLMELPASLMLFYWFFIQFFSGVASLAVSLAVGGVAWWAHIGGFAFGYLVGKGFKKASRGK